jgi:vesicle transport protein SEC22
MSECLSVFLGMQDLSKQLSDNSKKYLKDTKNLNLQALYQKYGPPAIVAAVILFVLFLRFYLW